MREQQHNEALATVYNALFQNAQPDNVRAAWLMLTTYLFDLEKRPAFSATVKLQAVEEDNLDSPHFHGETYEKEIDQKALKSDFFRVFDYMLRRHFYKTDVEISEATGVYIPTVQRMRSYMRSPEWGKHTVMRRRREGSRIFEFCLLPNLESLTFRAWDKEYNRSSPYPPSYAVKLS
jgi:hypothetical protein